MYIKKITENKKAFLDLLLLGDEQESMIDQYLDIGDMYVVYDEQPVAQCVVVYLSNGIYELKNISVASEYQGKGIGSILLDFISNLYKSSGRKIIVGTGETPNTISFYQKNGFAFLFSSESQEAENTGFDKSTKLRTRLMYFDLISLVSEEE